MPRIDPKQLISCLAVLLSPNGGIKSTSEVKRIASLMGKFSKKLVSKCIYILILKCSETDLLGQFMETGGWTLTHCWLQDAIESKNWPLVQEILELFLLCPVDVNRLKSNSAPKMVKILSKESAHEGVQILATKLVEQWLKVVKGEVVVFPSNTALTSHVLSSASALPSSSSRTANTTQMLIDPSNSAYVDNLAMADELGGADVDHHIDVDEIIPTINHHGSDDQLMEVDGSDLLLDYAHVPTTGISNNSHLYMMDKSSGGDIVDSSSTSNILNSNNEQHQNTVDKSTELKFKFTVKDGKTSLAKVNKEAKTESSKESDTDSTAIVKEKRSGDKGKSNSSGTSSKDRRSSNEHKRPSSSSSHHHKSSSRSSGGSSSRKSSSSSKDKERSSSSSSRRSSSSHSKSGSSQSSKDRSSSSSKDSKRKESNAISSNISKPKDTQADKDKDTLAKVMGGSALDRLGKIPKKVKTTTEEESTGKAAAVVAPVPSKKSSISIEVRKSVEDRPKTVKTLNSQFRDHGLGEEIPPPPSRKSLKKPAPPVLTMLAPKMNLSPSTPSLKRTSPPPKDFSSPVEKKMKLDFLVGLDPVLEKADKPGGIKLIAPRSKPIATLIESDMFMDALCSTATTTKKDTKKRKRRPSNSKDGSPPPESPKIVAAPLKFYQDTLEEKPDEEKKLSPKRDDEDVKEDGLEEPEEGPESPEADTKGADDQSVVKDEKESEQKSERKDSERASIEEQDRPAAGDEAAEEQGQEEEENMEVDDGPKEPGPGCGPGGPPGVLIIHRRKGPKKSVRWRPQELLEEVKFFELDETERVNVNKTFTDMSQMERSGERDAFMARKLNTDDVMVEQMPWLAPLFEVEDVPVRLDGSQSKEREIQQKREQTVLQSLYFNHSMIPDSATEPDHEVHKYTEPAVIPLEDGNPNTVNDFTKQGWPESKDMMTPHGGMMGDGGLPGVVGPFGGNGGLGFMGGPGGMVDPQHQFGGGQAPFNMPPFLGGGGGGGPPNNQVNPWQTFGGNQMGGGPYGGMNNMNPDELKMAINRYAFPGVPPPNLMQSNFNGINAMNLPALGAVGVGMGGGGGGPPPLRGGGPGNGPWFRPNGPPNGGNMPWRGGAPPMMHNNGPRPPPRGGGEWVNNNNNNNNNPRLCKMFKKGFCKKGDKCNFYHPIGGFNRS